MRRNMTGGFFTTLTGSILRGGVATNLDIDRALRDAFIADDAARAAKASVEASKLRIGVLPASLGAALLNYTNAQLEASTFEEGLSGRTLNDVSLSVRETFERLCIELAELRK